MQKQIKSFLCALAAALCLMPAPFMLSAAKAGTTGCADGQYLGAVSGGLGCIAAVTQGNLTGPITSVGLATSIASQTGTGTKFVVDTSPTLVTPTLGVASASNVNVTASTIPANGMYLSAANNLGFSINSALVAYINNSASPEFVFGNASAGAGATIYLKDATGNISSWGCSSDNCVLSSKINGGNNYLTLQTNNTNGIIVTPTQGVRMPGLASSSAATTGSMCWTTGTGLITVDTTVACLASDIRTKINVRPLESALPEIMALRPISYDNRPGIGPLDTIGRQVGLSAQDVEKVDKRLVSLYQAGADEGTPQGVRYMQLTAVLIKGMQEQQAEIEALKDEVRGLKRLGTSQVLDDHSAVLVPFETHPTFDWGDFGFQPPSTIPVNATLTSLH